MEDINESGWKPDGELDNQSLKGVSVGDSACVDKATYMKTQKDKRKGFLRRKIQNISWYESKCEDLTKYFDDVPESEKLIYDCTCALQRDILYQGRLYICLNGLYFQAHVFKKEILVSHKWKDILTIKRSKTAKFIPNALLVATNSEQATFSSFGSRDKTFLTMYKLWQCSIKNIEMPLSEINLWIQYYYGDVAVSGSKMASSQEQKQFRNKIRDQLKLLQQHTSEDVVQEPHSSNDRNEDRGQSESSHFKGSNLLSIPSSFECQISKQDDDSNEGSEVFGDDLKLPSPKSNSPLTIDELKRSNIFPLRKSHSRSFEHLEILPHKGGIKRNSIKAGRKEKEEKGDNRRRSLQQELPDAASDESGQDSDTICQCGGHEELPELLLDDVYQMPVNYLFKTIFHKNNFWLKLLKSKKAKDVVLSPWSAETDGNGARVRNITYTLSLNYPFGPKHSPTIEKQILHVDSTPGEFYLVDTECVNNGLPYGEDFYIANRYCISKITDEKCRIRITSQIKYRKKVWGLVKAFIEKNATAGIMETFSIMGHLLRQEANQDQPTGQMEISHPSRKKLLRRKPQEKLYGNNDYPSPDENQILANFSIGKAFSPAINQTSAIMRKFLSHVQKKHNQRWISNLTFSQTVKIVTVLALALCVFNVFLFFKVHTLEHMTSQFETHLERSTGIKSFYQYHSLASKLDRVNNIEQWKDAMNSLLILMEEIANSVSDLANNCTKD